MAKKSKPKKSPVRIPRKPGLPSMGATRYHCWADKEDLTAQVDEKVQAISSQRPWSGHGSWKVTVVCSQGHENIFEGNIQGPWLRDWDRPLPSSKVPFSRADSSVHGTTKVPDVRVDRAHSRWTAAAKSFSRSAGR